MKTTEQSGKKACQPRTGLPLQRNGNNSSYVCATIEIVAIKTDMIRTSTEIEWASGWDTVDSELAQTMLP